MKDIKKRGLLMIVAIVLLLGIGVYMTYAWYTRITGVSAIDFNAARWDFSANYQADAIRVNVFEYESVYGGNIAAPGTAGTVNIRLGADESDVDVEYILMVDPESMSEEFQKRIYFYYYDADAQQLVAFQYGVNGMTGTIAARSAAFVEFYWEWVYDYDGYLEKNEEEKYVAASSILRPLYDSPIGHFTTMDEYRALYDYMVDGAEVIGTRSVNTGNSGNKYGGSVGSSAVGSGAVGSGAIGSSSVGSGAIGSGAVSGGAAVQTYNVWSGAVDYEAMWNARPDDTAYNALKILITLTDSARQTLFENEPQYGGSSSGILTEPEIVALKKYRDTYPGDIHCLQTLYENNYGSDIKLHTAYQMMEILRDFSEAQRKLFFANVDILNTTFGRTNVKVNNKTFETSEEYILSYVSAHNYNTVEDFFDVYLAEYNEFDAYDNKVGANPKYYQSQMTSTIYIIGTQIKPEAVN